MLYYLVNEMPIYANVQQVLTKCDPLEKEKATHSGIFAMKTSWTVPKGRKVYNILLGKSRGLARKSEATGPKLKGSAVGCIWWCKESPMM
uniref:Uncharacterized protein n=1 Tax=Laticauda laticaudata TaxID=8630 RepID=A0A8C5S4N2_LATLA